MDASTVYRSVKLLIDQFRTDAAVHTGTRTDAIQERDDMADYAVWKQIVKTIAEIQGIDRRTKH